ncbi:hypothetical protein [uncultured Paraprevotella sp.]|uniref:hypothetical protein n=1 Tax=Paraprevotella clara TaxID=454154 RepID=UPI00259BACF3|nr:hypothetical protein [uncultured Paraprevotella sp.]
MKKKKFFAPLLGALVLGLSAYAGYRTYDAYNGVSESELLLENAEALADDDEASKKPIGCYNEYIKGYSRFIYKCYPCGEGVWCSQALRPSTCIP